MTRQQYDLLSRKVERWGTNPTLQRQYAKLERFMRPYLPGGGEGSTSAKSLHELDLCQRHEVQDVLVYRPPSASRRSTSEQWLVRWRGVPEPTWHGWHELSGFGSELAHRLASKRSEFLAQVAMQSHVKEATPAG